MAVVDLNKAAAEATVKELRGKGIRAIPIEVRTTGRCQQVPYAPGAAMWLPVPLPWLRGVL